MIFDCPAPQPACKKIAPPVSVDLKNCRLSTLRSPPFPAFSSCRYQHTPFCFAETNRNTATYLPQRAVIPDKALSVRCSNLCRLSVYITHSFFIGPIASIKAEPARHHNHRTLTFATNRRHVWLLGLGSILVAILTDRE